MKSHKLELSYQDFVSGGKSIADSIIDHYIVYEKLDSGAFGSVYRGMDDLTKQVVAIKVVDLASIERDESSQKVKEIRRRLAKTESQMMLKCHSDHVMKLYDVYQNKWLKIMIIEFCNGETLSREIYHRGRVPEKEAIEILKQIIIGISAMHKQNIIHRDLKSDNIMSHNGIYKIVDLGFAKMIPSESQTYNTTLGTIITMAPQVMKKQTYGLKADIWSIGIIFYEMIYGKIPYEPMKANDMYDQILSKNIFPNNGYVNGYRPSQAVLNLLKKIIVIDKKQRIGWQELISQSIFSNKSLPEQYRITVTLNNVKKPYEVEDRTEEQVFEKLEAEKEYSVKDAVKVSKMNRKQKESKQKEINTVEKTLIDWAKATHLECLKTELILKQIILPIEEKKLLNLKSRRNMEFLYLLCSRCYLNMSFVLSQLEYEDHVIVQNLKETVRDLYEIVKEKFNFYGLNLTQHENKMSSIIEDRFSKIFKSKSFQTKDKFLVGMETIEFSKEQQIKFTHATYILPILSSEEFEDVAVMQRMKYYDKINAISVNNLVNKKFGEIVDQIIK